MSNVSFMEKLLDGVEVEWKALGNVTQYEQPTKDLAKNNLSSFPRSRVGMHTELN